MTLSLCLTGLILIIHIKQNVALFDFTLPETLLIDPNAYLSYTMPQFNLTGHLDDIQVTLDRYVNLTVLVFVNLLAYKMSGLKGFIYSWVIVQIIGAQSVLSMSKTLLDVYFNTNDYVLYLLLITIMNYEIHNIAEYVQRMIISITSFCSLIHEI